jgi:hypothetical protein
MCFIFIKLLGHYIILTIEVWPEDEIVMSKHVAMNAKN